MSDHAIAAAFQRQFDCCWTTLRDAISRLDDTEWRKGSDKTLILAYQAYHALELTDFFSRERPDAFAWSPLGVEWETAAPDELPGRERISAYLNETRERTRDWLGGMTDQDFLSPNERYYWTGPLILDHVIYSLRHLQNHIALINSEMRRRGLEEGEWK